MLNTLRIIFGLKSTYRVNSIIYSLKQLPLIKHLLPATLYRQRSLKTLAAVLATLWELVAAFGGKLLYFLLLLMLAPGLDIYRAVAPDALFLHILLLLSLIGGFMNTYLFNPSKDKYYAIILMRMNAKQHTLVDYGYALAKIIVGFLLFGLIFGLRAGIHLWQCLLIPFFVCGVKLSMAALFIRRFEQTGDAYNENSWGKLKWPLCLALLVAAYGPPALGCVLPPWLSSALMGLCLLCGVLSARALLRFDDYRAVHQQIQGQHMAALQQAKTSGQQLAQKNISLEAGSTSDKSGLDFLNDLFIRRHRKLLWRPAQRISLVCAALIVFILGLMQFFPDEKGDVGALVINSLPYLTLMTYFINRGSSFTNALFMNCDHSLLTYAFYKQPSMILRLFRIRLIEIAKVNLLPTGVIALGLDVLLFAAGGTDEPINYLVLPVTILSMGVFFSVHYLTLYYLLQPYNAGTEMKSSLYQVCVSCTYVVCYLLATQVQLSALAFGGVTIAFCLLYSVVACALVYKFAPQTFRLRA